ncbi:MAG: choice-of-anchor A family protein [Melioribacteraceae bacterium]|nr:MAG: choice-of-anchor A family protein [Melioribacteraceae bacterium]
MIKVLVTVSFLLLFSNNVFSTDPDSTSTGSQGGQSLLFQNYGVNGTKDMQGTNIARVTGKDKGVDGLKFTNPYNNNQLTVYAGTFKGTLDGNNAKFYCIDISHFISYYSQSNPHEYTDDGSTSDEITYILNNYYPLTNGPGNLSEVEKEAAAVQMAIWHFADGVNVNTLSNNSTVKNRALAIINAASGQSGNMAALPNITINPAVQFLQNGNNGSFTVLVVDQNNNPMNGVQLTLTTTSGNLSQSSASTNANGLTGSITITQGNSNSATIDVSTTATIPQGTRYVHTIEPNQYQKLVLATPTSVTRTGQGLVNWYLQGGDCDLTGYVTFTQGGWGNKNGVPAQIRNQYFDDVFPSGLIVGNGYTLKLTSASAVKDFLPQGSTPLALTQNYVDPGSSNISILAGQVVALAMNVYFDQAGKIGTNSTDLGNLVIESGTFAGKSVFEFLEIAETALGGGNTGYSLSAINDAATAINENFNDGNTNHGYLTCQVQLEKISPILECVINNGDGTYTAHFGYNNPNSVVVNIPIGTDNKFTPGAQNQGQPTSFNPGRTDYFPDSEFTVTFDENTTLVWTLNGKTATASKNSAPCSEHIFFEKKWYDENNNLMNSLPDDLPSNYYVMATSSLGTATGIYVNGTLQFTYVNNNSSDTNGLHVPVNGEYTVEEFNLPAGYSPIFGIGTFTAELPGGYASNPYNGFNKYGLHTIKNKKEDDVCVIDWTGSFGPDSAICLYEPQWITITGSVQLIPNPSIAKLQTTWRIVNPNDNETDNSTHYASVWITGDTTFTITAWWPGIKSTDTVVELHFGANILDCDGNPIHNGIGRDLYWYPWVCNPPVDDEADLSLVKTVDDENPEDGETVNFTITVTNNGPKDATGVEVSDLLPEGLDYISYSTTHGTYNQASGLWVIGNLANGEIAQLHIAAMVDISEISVSTLDLGPAKGFNVFVLKDMSAPSSDTEGKLAVGRNADLAFYSVGDKLPNSNGAEDVLIVDNNLTFTSGAVYSGNVVYGNSTNLPIDLVSINNGTLRKDNPIDFTAASNYLINLSTQLHNYTTNGTTTYEWSELKLVGNDPFLNVFAVNGSDLANATNFVINVPNGSVVIVNIDGTTVNDWSGGLVVTGTSRTNVLYNFFNATNVTISNIGIEGSILAPKASVNFVDGQQNGQMIAKYLTGKAQYNNTQFLGNIPVDTTIVNFAEITHSDLLDPDSTPNNGNLNEDDYGTAALHITQEDLNNTNGNTGTGNNNPTQNWNQVGSFLPGEIVASLSNDIDGNILAGTWGGKLYRSNDDGANWTQINSGMNVGFIWSIAVNSTGDIFVATEQGVFFSTNNGGSWNLSGISGIDVRALSIDGNGHLYAGTWGLGVYKSNDNGTSWSFVGLENLAVNSIVIDSQNDVYAATFGFGIYKSEDAGTSWVSLNNGYAHIWALGITSTDEIYAGTYGDGVYTSSDLGDTWQKTANGLPVQYVYAITVDAGDNVYISSWANGVYSTSDNGLSWNSFGMAGYGVSSLMVNPASTTLYAGTSEGAIFKVLPGEVTSTDGVSELPTEFKLNQNYPNPFNPSTTIEFSIKDAGNYSIKIFNILGEQVANIGNKQYAPGNYSVTFDAGLLSSGMYIYQLSGNNVNITKKMMLMK